MPNKKGHQVITMVAAGMSMPAAIFMDIQHFTAFEVGVLVTLVPELTPDLDVAHRRFGWLGEFLGLRSYARLVPHRFGLRKKHWSRLKVWNLFFFSHLPLIGTLPRTIIVTIFLLFPFLLFGTLPGWVVEAWLMFWLGMSYSDAWHVIADIITSDLKPMKRSFWGRRWKKR